MLIALVVVLVLGFVPTVEAAGRFAGPWDQFLSWIGAWIGIGASSESDAGAAANPDGTLASSTAKSDAGAAVDPNGRTRTSSSTATLDDGPAIDPDGKPR